MTVAPGRAADWLPLVAEVLGLPADEAAARYRAESFTALGGSSLQAIALGAHGQRRLSRDVEVAGLLGPDPLAAVLAGARAFAPSVPPPVDPAAAPRPRPLLPGQRAMLAAHLAGQDQPYRLLFTLRPPEPLDPGRTRAALRALTARHESLRTMFTAEQPLPGEQRTVRRLVLPATHEPRLLHQTLPAGTDAVRAVHELYAARAGELLRPFDRPPVVFVRTRAGAGTLLSVLVHHALADGWSIGVLWREFARLYEGGPGALPATGPSPDWIGTRLAAREASGDLAAATAGVRRRLDGAPLVATLPGGPDPAGSAGVAGGAGQPGADGNGARLVFELPQRVAEGVDRLARHCRTTVTSVLLAAWSLAAARRTGTADLVLGVAAAGRFEAGMEDVVGLCTRIVPVRCRIDGARPVTEHVRATAGALAAALADADLPFDRVVTALDGTVDGTRNPVAQLGFAAHHELVPDSFEAAGGSWRVYEGHCAGSAFDALLYVQSWSPRPRLAIEYATSAQSAADVGELAESLHAVLAELAAEPQAAVERIAGLSTGQLARLRELGLGVDPATGDDLWSRFERQVRERPDATALLDPDAGHTLTYRQLHARALDQAELLHGCGVRAGDRVVLELPRSAAEAVAVLATLRLGAAWVAVDSAAPAARRAQIAAAVAATARIGGAADDPVFAGVPRCPQAGPGRALPAGRPAGAGPGLAPHRPEPARAAYVSFTSGTTGVPKGVVVPHRAVLRLVDDADLFADTDLSADGPGASMLRLSPLAFDASTLELLVPLASGTTVVVHPPAEPTPDSLARFLPAAGVTHAWLTAGLFHLVADHRPEALRGLRQVFTGGGVVSPAHVRRVLEQSPGLRVTNGYGPTENTTFTTVCHVEGVAEVSDPFPIGRPVHGTGVRLTGPDGRLVPPGAVGELRATGAGLADGYLGDPERTAQSFGERAGEREYRTGDLARWGADGRLLFLGRVDRQLKVAGYRIEPAAVERRIKEQEGVLDAVVLLAGERLCAAVKAEGDIVDRVRAAVEPVLAPYERPQRWRAVARFPLDRNGKVDLRALGALFAPAPGPDLAASGPVAATRPVAAAEPVVAAQLVAAAQPVAIGDPAAAAGADPVGRAADDAEELIRDVWTEVLGTDDFDFDEGFFDVGGDSLTLAMVRTRLERRLGGRPVGLAELYRYPTVQALAQHLRTT
ncbi:amino acid adenylation domain-containing protein [Kitasatospora purpeofusca]|uniref:amino acid adenylation domain-containing protein n=1 Tax=Kitasatospora purpeofusca TaxID=67352 RepID=UPI002A5989EB|nr:amino acid adenylation domain-containing protein [Kitasatospora purpeofusca]MDY0812680.1 amino acid adenylation domain-containing protein [Kitasatospora purpeofusca]